MLKRLLHGVQLHSKLIGGIVLLSALVVWLIFGRITMTRSYYLPNYSNIVYSLAGNAVISQDFSAKYPGLYQIDLYLRRIRFLSFIFFFLIFYLRKFQNLL